MRETIENTEQIEYITGLAEFERLARDSTFLAFVGMYDDAGSHTESGTVAFSTSDSDDAALAAHWIRRLSGSKVSYVIDFEPGADVVELVRFWAARLGVSHEQLRLRRARFREEVLGFRAAGFDEHGVLTVRSTDPILRIRLQAWMDKARAELVRSGW